MRRRKLRESKNERVLSVKTFAGTIRRQGIEEQTNEKGLSVKTLQGTASRTRSVSWQKVKLGCGNLGEQSKTIGKEIG